MSKVQFIFPKNVNWVKCHYEYIEENESQDDDADPDLLTFLHKPIKFFHNYITTDLLKKPAIATNDYA